MRRDLVWKGRCCGKLSHVWCSCGGLIRLFAYSQVGELRKMCDEHALPVQGSKSDLVLRLQAMISRIPTTPHRANSDQALLVAAAERLSAGRKSAGTRLPKALRRGGGGQALKDISA